MFPIKYNTIFFRYVLTASMAFHTNLPLEPTGGSTVR